MRRVRDQGDEESRKRARYEDIKINHLEYNERITQVPLEVKIQFRKILQVKEEKFDSYRPSEQEPWRQDTKKRANRQVYEAARLREELQNEQGWRELETRLFERFSVEIAW